MKTFLFLVSFVLVATLGFGAGETLERYALVTGSNLGGRGTTPLKYASGDAKRFQDVLTKLGGLKEENALLLVNPGRESLVQGLAFLQSKIRKNRQPDRQVQFVFYYSGHSDDRGLLLAGERFDYGDLKTELDKMGAEVQIVVLDSCASGAFTRTKGGQIGAPFLKDLSTQVEGHAFLTSSTAEELSQESDRMESSFFTHALVEGLRGAADANGDGTVTLNEAYEYAYGQTMADTQATTAGTQHPAYDIQLNGQGNLVMTDLRSGGATLVFPKEMGGRITVRDIANKLLAEVQKSPDQELVLGIDEGYYKIDWETKGTLAETTTLVDEPRAYRVEVGVFQAVEKTRSRTRGGASSGVSWSAGGVAFSSDEGGPANLVLSLLGGQVSSLDGGMLSVVYNRVSLTSSGFQGSLVTNISGEDFHGVQATFGVNLTNGDLVGVQNGWLVNRVGNRMSGVQLGAVNLVDGDGQYLQLGGWNQANAQFTGVQAGALFNWARSLNGVQVGLVNYSEEQTGVQIGLVNISKKLTGLPLGLIDIQFNGQNHFDQTLGFTGNRWETVNRDLATTSVLRFGSEYFYKYFSFQTRIAATGRQDGLPALAFGAGLGLRFPVFVPGLALHLDGGTSYQRDHADLEFTADPKFFHKFVPQFRTFVSWSFWQNFGVLAGWDHPVYTEFYHEGFSKNGKFAIRTDWGNLFVGSRFFLGLQL